jgi:hypothetical protein
MTKQKILLSGTLNAEFKVIRKKGSAFGFVVEYKGQTYEPNISLHLIENSSKHNYKVSYHPYISFDNHSTGFIDVEGACINMEKP